MSARKADSNTQGGLPGEMLTLLPNAVRFHKNGIEFRVSHPIAAWTEMTVTVRSPRGGRKLNCTGVVVACSGNSKSGYAVSMVFTNLSRQSQALLSSWALPLNSISIKDCTGLIAGV
jgi:hypothetical protein